MLMIQNCRYVKPMPADMRGVKRMRRRGKEQTLISELIQGRFMIHSTSNLCYLIFSSILDIGASFWDLVKQKKAKHFKNAQSATLEDQV